MCIISKVGDEYKRVMLDRLNFQTKNFANKIKCYQ